MPAGFYLGIIVALVLLALGLGAGLFLGRHFARSRRSEPEELQPVLSSLVQFTSAFSQDVSEYRSLIETVAQRAKVLSGETPLGGENVADDPARELLGQIMQANEHLRRRLDDAEASLQCKSQELQSYMAEARTDALTGLPNRRAWDDELARRIAAHRRQGTPLAVALIDVDRFKSVNDRYGHPIGDRVLKAVAESLRQAVRDSDLLARYGGEEFAVALTGNTSQEFLDAAERFRRFVEQLPIPCSGAELRITVSCGVAEAVGAEEPAALIQRADAALYASKSAGRNCTHWHDGRGCVRVGQGGESTAAGPESSEHFRQVCADLRRKLLELT